MSIEFRQRQLDNGLTVIAEINPDAHTAAVGLFVRAGTRDETPACMGISHFLEHMLFKGTATRTGRQLNEDFDRIGADYNAYTDHETTAYHAHVLPEYLPAAIDLISDMLQPTLDAADCRTERQVILEEISMYADQPFWVGFEQLQEYYFAHHPMGYRVLGHTETVSNITPEQLRQYFQAKYVTGNMVLALAGRLNFDDCCRRLEQCSNHWPQGSVMRDATPPPAICDRYTIANNQLNRQQLLIMAPGPSRQSPDRYPAMLLAQILGDEDGSRLYWQLIDPGLADDMEFSIHLHDRFGYWFAYASCDPHRRTQVLDMLLQTIHQPMRQITDDEILRARSKIALGITLQQEQPAGRMLSIGQQWLYEPMYLDLDQELETISQLTADDLLTIAHRYPIQPHALLSMGPT